MSGNELSSCEYHVFSYVTHIFSPKPAGENWGVYYMQEKQIPMGLEIW